MISKTKLISLLNAKKIFNNYKFQYQLNFTYIKGNLIPILHEIIFSNEFYNFENKHF